MKIKVLSETPFRVAASGGTPRMNSKPPCGGRVTDDLITSEAYTELFSENPGASLGNFDPSPQPRPNFPIKWGPNGWQGQTQEVATALCQLFGCPPGPVMPGFSWSVGMNEEGFTAFRKDIYCKAWLSSAQNLANAERIKCEYGGVSEPTGRMWSSLVCGGCVPQYRTTCHQCKKASDCGDPKCRTCKTSNIKNDLSRPYKMKYCADKSPPCTPTPTPSPTPTITPTIPCNCGQYAIDNSSDPQALECKNKCCVHDNTGAPSPYANSNWCQGCAQIVPDHPLPDLWSCPPGWELGIPRDEQGNVNAPPYCLCCQTVCHNGTCQPAEGCPPPPNIGP